jgi:hypothetical protein
MVLYLEKSIRLAGVANLFDDLGPILTAQVDDWNILAAGYFGYIAGVGLILAGHSFPASLSSEPRWIGPLCPCM